MDIENVQLTKRRYFVKSLSVNMQNLPVKFFSSKILVQKKRN